jgi:cytochrome c-type biogenesis protein CcmF
VGFLAIGIAITIYLILDRLDYLKSEARLESVVSRESSFLFNNLILLASCFAVLWGTMFPVISESSRREDQRGRRRSSTRSTSRSGCSCSS